MVNNISNKSMRRPTRVRTIKESYQYDKSWTKYGVPSTEDLLSDYETFGDSYFECFDDYTSDGYHIVISIEDGKFTIALFNEDAHTENVSTFTKAELERDGIGSILNSLNAYAYPSDDYELYEKCKVRKTANRANRKESRVATRRTNKKLKEWFNPNAAVEDLSDALEIINSVATNAQRSDDFRSAKPITAVATQLKDVINSLKIK